MGNFVGKEITQEDINKYLPIKASELTLLNDDNSYTTPNWVNKLYINNRASASTSDDDDSKFITSKLFNEKLYKKLEDKIPKPSDNINVSGYATPKFVLDNLPKSATSGETGYATPKFVLENAAKLTDAQVESIGRYVLTSQNFVPNLGKEVAKDATNLPANILDELMNNNTRKDVFLSNFTTKLLNTDTHKNKLLTNLANTLTDDPIYASVLKGKDGDLADEAVLKNTLQPKTMWCATGQLCEIPATSNGFKLQANQSISSSAENKTVVINDNVELPGNIQFLSPSLRSVPGQIEDGKFGSNHGIITPINNTEGTDKLAQAKNSHLTIRGLGKSFISNSQILSSRPKVKIEDDLVVKEKMSIGPNTNIDDNYNLVVGGPTFIDGLLTVTNLTSGNLQASNLTVGNLNITGTVSGIKLDDFDSFTKASDTTSTTGVITKNAEDRAWSKGIRGNESRKGFLTNSSSEDNDKDATASSAEYTVPENMKTCYLIHLPWSSGRYFDVLGKVKGTNDYRLIQRVDAYNDIELLGGDENSHAEYVVIPMVDRFSHIKIKGGRGRFHIMGLGWSKTFAASNVPKVNKRLIVNGRDILAELDNKLNNSDNVVIEYANGSGKFINHDNIGGWGRTHQFNIRRL